ncbi:aromatic acid exporter family protein [Paenibacillus sp. CC-CFT747]|nr:aromatic acid exporter family protein [Paenibacillus sp. CC-CFT747]
MTFGARVLKTGIAVTLALYISDLLAFKPPVIAAVAAIFAMQPSIYRSWRYFLEQLQTNTLGAALAMGAGTIFSNKPIAVGLVCILVIMICLKMGMEETVGLTLVTVIAVMEASGQWEFALNRFLLSLIGIASACLINIVFFPPRPKEQFIVQIHTVFDKLSLLLRTVISDEIKEKVFREEKRGLEDSLHSLSEKYKLFEEEIKRLRKGKFGQVRLLVVYKQMLHGLRTGLTVLDVVEQHYFQAARSAETDKRYDAHLERLIKLHEHIMLKFDGKIKADSASHLNERENEAFIQETACRMDGGKDGPVRLTIVASAMYDYGHQLFRLDRLVEHYLKGTEDKESESLLPAWLRR